MAIQPNTNPTNLSGTFSINDNDRFQSIHSSQNYGTFYQIYAKLNFDDKNYLKSIIFYIQNYKGLINLGFVDKNAITIKNKRNGVIEVTIKIKGLADKKELTYDAEHNNIEKNEIEKIVVKRILMKLSDNPSSKMKSEVFDDEFHYRSGKDDHDRKPKKGQDGYEGKVGIRGEGPNCYTSENIVVPKPKKNN